MLFNNPYTKQKIIIEKPNGKVEKITLRQLLKIAKKENAKRTKNE